MHRTVPPLLTRLRRYRGLWLLAFAAMLIKLLSSSVCLGDAPATAFAAAQATTTLSVAVDLTGVDAAVDDPCLLDEAGSCHCACAHALSLTSQTIASIGPLPVQAESVRLSPGLTPATTGSLLRPPIA